MNGQEWWAMQHNWSCGSDSCRGCVCGGIGVAGACRTKVVAFERQGVG